MVSASPETLAGERDLLRLLYGAQKFGADVPKYLRERGTPDLVATLLRDAETFTRSQALGSRAAHRSARLSWEALLKVFGSEDALRDAVDEIRGSDESEEFKALIELTDRYLSGWRPLDFGDDA